jgi:hypothetical protein
MRLRNNSFRKQRRLVPILALTVAAILFLNGRSPLAQSAQAQDMHGVPVRNDAGDMECVSYCSVTQPGKSVMEVKWRLAERALSEEELRARATQQGLEVTVYAEGFERGQYAAVSAVKPKAFFREPLKTTGVAPKAQPRSKLPGLERLNIYDVATRLNKAVEPFHLLTPSRDISAEWLAVRLEGSNPGMQYTYRVPGTKSVIACQAVVCPVDRVSPPTAPKPKPAPTSR